MTAIITKQNAKDKAFINSDGTPIPNSKSKLIDKSNISILKVNNKLYTLFGDD